MKRFLSTTAVLLALTGPAAYAQTQTENFGAVQAEQNDFFASDLIGMRIYNAETEMDAETRVAADAEREWDDIGEINDLILSKDGSVRAVILGVGGFLGIGEKDVAVSMDDISIVREEGDMGDYFLVVNTSKEVLENAPEFDRDMDVQDQEQTASSDTMTTTETAAATDATETETETEAATAVDTDATETETAADTETADTTTETAAVTETDSETGQTETAEVETADEENVTADAGTDNVENMEQSQTATLTRPAMERDGYQNAEMADIQQLNSDEIEGSYVYGVNDETVGEIDALIMNTDGQVTEAVINVGGFLGIGEKPVKVAFDSIQVLKDANGGDYRFYIESSEEKLEALPRYSEN